MAINTLNYTVLSEGVTPNYERRAGMQYDHNKTQLQFTLDSALYDALIAKLIDGQLNYRIDLVDGEGKRHLGETKPLESKILEPYMLSYWVTKFGGKLKACLIITLSNDSITTTEFSCEVVVSLEDLPEINTTESDYKSLTTLSGQTADYVKEAKTIKDEITDLYDELGEIKNMIDSSEWVFDGDTVIDVNFVIDNALNLNSKNAVSNSVITENFNLLNDKVNELSDGISQNLYNSVVSEIKSEILLAAHPIGSYYWSSESINPQNLFGGVWEQIKDVFVLAAGDKYSVGATGGEASHKLSVSEMPKHAHGFKSDYNADGIDFEVPTKTGGSGTTYMLSGTTARTPAHWAGETWGTVSAGGNMAHNNMPPYLSAYCFKRIG